MRELRSAWRFVVTLAHGTAWIMETLLLGTRAVWRLARIGLRWKKIIGRTMVCLAAT